MEMSGNASNKGIVGCNETLLASFEGSDGSLCHKKCAYSIAFHKVRIVEASGMVLPLNACPQLHNPAFSVFSFLPLLLPKPRV